MIVECVWESSTYSVARTPEAIGELLRDCGAERVEVNVLATPLAKYKIVMGSW